MDPSSLVTPQLINFCTPLNSIIICGFTKTGKITIAKKLANSLNRHLLISDEYINNYGYDNSLEKLIEDIKYFKNHNIPFIVEGILCFRLLRKSAKLKSFYPDLIIKTECDNKTISYFYNKDGENHKLERALIFNKGLNTIWNEYKEILKNDPFLPSPKFLSLNTSLK
jgi:hypothetical protein